MTNSPALPPPKRARKHRSKSVELSACLYLLTQAGEEIPFHVLRSSIEVALKFCLKRLGVDPTLPWEIHHEPPLALRPFDPIADDYDPRENDYRRMRPIQKAGHAEETKRLRSAVDKTRRLAKAQAKHSQFIDRKSDRWPYPNSSPTGTMGAPGDPWDTIARDEYGDSAGHSTNYGRNYLDDRGVKSGPPRKHKNFPSKWPKGRPLKSRGFPKKKH